jgi:hypothetical protein
MTLAESLQSLPSDALKRGLRSAVRRDEPTPAEYLGLCYVPHFLENRFKTRSPLPIAKGMKHGARLRVNGLIDTVSVLKRRGRVEAAADLNEGLRRITPLDVNVAGAYILAMTPKPEHRRLTAVMEPYALLQGVQTILGPLVLEEAQSDYLHGKDGAELEIAVMKLCQGAQMAMQIVAQCAETLNS